MSLRADRPTIRLLFDENLPWRVAAALRILEFPVSHIGDNSASPPSPNRGSSDETVLSHAENANQLIVTSNLDMILLCVERSQSMIWIDPRGEHLRRAELALIAFKGIDDWSEQLAAADAPVCLRAMRTKTNTLTLEEAGRLARDRMSNITRARSRKKRPKPLGELVSDL